MRICISGVSGFIGQEIAIHLKGHNHEIVSIGRTNPCIDGIAHFNFDMLDFEQSTIDVIGSCDVFVHCSFIMASSNNLDDINVLNDNIRLTYGIVNIVKILKIKSFVNISSMAVYPNSDGTYSEDSKVDTSDNNDCLYGLSKICAENIFNHFLSKRNGIPVTNLRISQVFGERMNKGRTYYIMKNQLKIENKISVWSNGERVSNFVDVKKVSKVVRFFVENPQLSDTYNLGGDNLSYAELAKKIIEEFGNLDSKIVLIDKGVKAKFYLNTNKLDNLLTINNYQQ